MPGAVQTPRTVINMKACRLASSIGREIEAEIIRKAIRLAKQDAGCDRTIVVTVDHVRASLAACHLDEVRQLLGDHADDDVR